MKAQKPEYTRQLPPVGNHVARVINIIYLGTQHSDKYGDIFKMRITWELPNEKAVFKEGEPEKPFVVSKETSLSMGQKSTLRPIVEGILGVALTDDEAYNFDLDQLVGMSCMLYITHEEGETAKYSKVNTATPLPKGLVCPPPFNELKILSFEKWNEEFFQKLPQFIREKITSSKEYKKMKGDTVEEVNPEDVPF